MSSTPRVSVILLNRNGGARLSAALAALRAQRPAPPELIVVDLGSSDDSLARLERHRGELAHLARADGATPGEALNRALPHARGEWVLPLDGRDRLVGDAILGECLNWARQTEAGVIAGEMARDDGRIVRLRSRVNALAGDFAPASATFYRRSLFEENGGFDAALRVMARYEFNLRLWKNRVRFKPIPLRVTAAAASPRFDATACREEIRVRHRYFPAWRCWPWDAVSLLRGLRPGRGA